MLAFVDTRIKLSSWVMSHIHKTDYTPSGRQPKWLVQYPFASLILKSSNQRLKLTLSSPNQFMIDWWRWYYLSVYVLLSIHLPYWRESDLFFVTLLLISYYIKELESSL